MTSRPATPTLAKLITDAIEGRLAELHTGLPAKVERFNAGDESTAPTVDVTPLLKQAVRNPDQTVSILEMPRIDGVPVAFPRGGGMRITWPLAVGDTVFLAFAERSLERWRAHTPGEPVDPVDARKHNLSDAVAIASLTADSGPLRGAHAADLVIGREDGSGELRIKPDGSIEMGSAAGAKAAIGRIGDAVTIDAITDADLIAWFAVLHTAISTAPGTAAPLAPHYTAAVAAAGLTAKVPITTATGKIEAGSSKVTSE